MKTQTITHRSVLGIINTMAIAILVLALVLLFASCSTPKQNNPATTQNTATLDTTESNATLE